VNHNNTLNKVRTKAPITPIEQYVIDAVTKLRRAHRLSQRDIAKIINASASFIGNVENIYNGSKYNLKHINSLADYFQMSPKAFLPDKAL